MSESNPKAGEHGFSGACCPRPGTRYSEMETFSVGIFEWLPKASKKGLKKGAVKVRVRGSGQNPEAVYAKARHFIRLLNAGNYDGPKSVKA